MFCNSLFLIGYYSILISNQNRKCTSLNSRSLLLANSDVVHHNSPHSVMTMLSFGLFCGPTGTLSILRSRSKDTGSNSLPNTTCFPSSQSHGAHVMKNWQPFVSGPLFACISAFRKFSRIVMTGLLAIDKSPGSVCLYTNDSSANLSP